MPFYKKPYNKQQKVYYPCAMMQGNSVETETIAKDLAKISTVSNFDVQAVLGGISGVMHTRMAQGKSNDFDFQKQVKAVRIKFIPERSKLSNGTYPRALVDSDELEWIEFSPDTKDTTSGGEDGNGDTEENPLK